MNDEQKRRTIFMYGIFRKDYGRVSDDNPHMSYIGPRRVQGYSVFVTEYGAPAYAMPKDGGHIQGDLYEIDEEYVLGYIDRVEQHPVWYKRTEVVTEQGEKCEMYVYQDGRGEPLNDIGPDWVMFVRARFARNGR